MVTRLISTLSTTNAAGVSQRVKRRLRWYDRPFAVIDNPILETKVKENLLESQRELPNARNCVPN